MADQLGSDQKQLEANLALLELDGVDVDVLRNMIVGTPSREGELGVEDGSQTGDFNGMSFISNGNEIAVTGGKADVSGISGEISLQGYQYGAAIPDSVVLQLDAQALSGYSDGDTVSTWPDESGEGNDATNGTSVYRASGFNGYPSVEFDGTDDNYDLPAFLDGVSSAEVMVVLELSNDPPNSGETGLWGFSTRGDGNISHYPFEDGQIYENWGRDSRVADVSPAVSEDSPHIYNVASGSDYRAWQNDTQIFSSTSSSVAFADYLLGSSGDETTWLNGNIAELVVYTPELDSSTRSDERSRLASKWDITF